MPSLRDVEVYLGLVLFLLVGVILAEVWSQFYAPWMHDMACGGLLCMAQGRFEGGGVVRQTTSIDDSKSETVDGCLSWTTWKSVE